MQQRIVELIGRVNHDEITAELLRLNDELNNLFLRHQRYEKNRDPQNSSTPSAILGQALIGLGDESQRGLATEFAGLKVAGTASSQLSQINSVTAQSGSTSATRAGDIDEFDMLAQSRNDTKT